jgi:hypothetical protein
MSVPLHHLPERLSQTLILDITHPPLPLKGREKGQSLQKGRSEGEGFEPPFRRPESGFQDRRLQPLGHPSGKASFYAPGPCAASSDRFDGVCEG